MDGFFKSSTRKRAARTLVKDVTAPPLKRKRHTQSHRHGHQTQPKTDKENESQEEEDIDVKVPVARNKTSGIACKVFGIIELLTNIMQYISIVEITKFRRVSKLFKNELEFGFECYNFNIFFYYKNKFVIDVINSQYRDSLPKLILFYLQIFNIDKYAVAFGLKEKDEKQEQQQTCAKINTDDMKSAIGESSIIIPVLPDILMRNELPSIDPLHRKRSQYFDFAVDFENLCTSGNVNMNPFKTLYFKIKLLNQNMKNIDNNINDNNMDNTIDLLQLCRMYNYKPCAKKLKDMIKNKPEYVFKKCQCYNDRSDNIERCGLGYIWNELGIEFDIICQLFMIHDHY